MENFALNTIENNLLIIDDELEITKALTRQFRKKYNVFASTSAEEGFRIMEEKNIQVVLSDQRMPLMSGVDFFKKIKDKYPDALKLILTGYSDIEAVIGAINDGQVFRYVTKPWNPDELDTIIKEAFEKYELITNNRKMMHTLRRMNQNLEDKVKERTYELEKLNEKLSELNIEKNKYIGMVAHDLANPIGTALTFSDLLIEEYPKTKPEKQYEYLKYINESCSFSIDLINDFLDVAKIEAGIFELNLNQQEYYSFIKKSIKQSEIIARNKLQEIKIISESKHIVFYFDTNKIKQVVNNLLSNAIKYSDKNTLITIEILVNPNNVITKIIDQGQGIPANELANIFQSFQTTSVKPTANEKSTGLGLAIVKKIIEAHNGTIKVETELGQGSIFTFELPLTKSN